MSDWHWRFGRYVTAGCVAIAAAWPLVVKAQVDSSEQRDEDLRQQYHKEGREYYVNSAKQYGLPYDGKPITYIEKDADGAKIRIVKWEIGTRNHIVNLRIPTGYVPPSYPPNQSLGTEMRNGISIASRFSFVADEFSFYGLFHDKKIRSMESFSASKISNKDKLIITGDVSTTFPMENATGLEIDDRPISIPPHFVFQPQLWEKFSLREKSGIAGLRRLGFDPVERYKDSRIRYPEDYYFIGETPENSPTSIICLAKELREWEFEGGIKLVPLCQHEFRLEALSAKVMLFYSRDLLGSWREIQQQSEQLLLSFLPKND